MLNNKTKKHKYSFTKLWPRQHQHTALEYGLGQEQQRIDTTEAKFFRHVAAYILTDQIRNIKLRNELRIFNLNNKIKNDIPVSKCTRHVEITKSRAYLDNL
jgi:hypothetical protein